MSTFTDRREATWRWLGIAPPIVVLSICLSAVGALASWTWLIAGEVREQQTAAAVALEKAAVAQSVANDTASVVNDRLNRIEDKLDRLLERTSASAPPTTRPRDRETK